MPAWSHVLRGSPTGTRYSKRIAQSHVTATNHATGSRFTLGSEAGDLFGFALATGDFNNDGFDDLAIGAPGENNASGGVTVLRGSSSGFIVDDAQYIDQRTNGGSVEPGDNFGYSLAAGRFNDGAYSDLAISAPFENYGGKTAGVVAVLRGTSTRLVNHGGFLHQGMGHWANETGDEFGYSLAAGNLDNDSRDEMAIGAPGENGGNGYVFVFGYDAGWAPVWGGSKTSSRLGESLVTENLYAGAKGLVAGAPEHAGGNGQVFVWQSTAGAPVYWYSLHGDGSSEAFGSALALNSQGLVVGSPGHSGGGSFAFQRTLVLLLHGSRISRRFLRRTRTCPGHSRSILPPEDTGAADFGSMLLFGNFNLRGGEELVVGAPAEEIRGSWYAGALFVYTSDNGTTLQDARIIDQTSMRYGRARVY